ncbi:50S ribosomal protein L25 [Hutsoniella sourekii]|uniref:50S ribosomal protein L25 n=1 Tax=Hutsoniella sourekii TaxID=87650 RepID=UPI000486DF54|nr:50S ribosomal protein L25 [Hutsoniella sourekii]
MALKAELRTSTGTGSAKRVRREGRIPVSLYGKEIEAISLTIDRREFEQLLRQEGSNAVFDLEYDGNTQKVWIKDFEAAALKDLIYYVDLEAISANQKLEVEVPAFLVNEESIKVGTAELIENAILVETTPDNIPQNIEIDVTGLEIGDVLTVADLKVPENVTVLLDADQTVVTVSAPMDEPEEVDPDAAVAEPEVIGEGENDGEDE